MSEFGVDAFDGIGVRLALSNGQFTRKIDQTWVDLILITELLHPMRGLVDHSLEGFSALLPDD
jgi:hypothetical protein